MGQEIHDDILLFETLVLEGMAAGLNRKMVQNKKKEYRRAFDKFDIKKISQYSDQDIERLMTDKGIIRNFRKISSVVTNAQAVIKIQEEYGSFDKYIWQFVKGKPLELKEKDKMLPERISKALKKKGFKFIGPASLHVFLYVTGMQKYSPGNDIL